MRLPCKPENNIARRGFTLIELAIVLAILGLLLGGGSMLLQPMLDNNKRNETKSKLKSIEDALAVYAANNDDIPCPSNMTLGPGSASNGIPANICNVTMAFGGVPWQALGLSEADVLDGWGRRISYAVTSAVAKGDDKLKCSGGFKNLTPGILQVRGASDTAPPDPRAAYVLISHGENGAGGYLPSGARLPITTASETETINSKSYGSAPAGVGDVNLIFYYEKRDSGDTKIGFDDIVRFRTSGQLTIAYGCKP